MKLRVTYERKQQYYATPYSLTREQYDRAMHGQRQTDLEKKAKMSMLAYEQKATSIIDTLALFDWNKFEKLYFTNRAAKNTLNQAFADYAATLRAEGRIGTAVTYECAQGSLNRYRPGARFADVSPDFLKGYENWMLGEGNGVSSVGIYLRNLRALINRAIDEGLLNKEAYPFGKRKYDIPTSNNVKKALTLEQVGTIYNYQLEQGSTAAMCRDYWMFIYLCNGLNMKDLALLKYENIKGDVLEFIRAKSQRTKRKVEAIRVPMSEEIREIIKRRGNPADSGYMFPILEPGITAERQREVIKLKTRLVNDHMKVIAAALGIEREVTTYFARHSFATILKRSGASTEFIGEALGHGDVKTTQRYLDSFEDDVKAETLKALTAFKKKSDEE